MGKLNQQQIRDLSVATIAEARLLSPSKKIVYVQATNRLYRCVQSPLADNTDTVLRLAGSPGWILQASNYGPSGTTLYEAGVEYTVGSRYHYTNMAWEATKTHTAWSGDVARPVWCTSNWAGAWSATKTFAVGDFVCYNPTGKVYKVVELPTAWGANTEPEVGSLRHIYKPTALNGPGLPMWGDVTEAGYKHPGFVKAPPPGNPAMLNYSGVWRPQVYDYPADDTKVPITDPVSGYALKLLDKEIDRYKKRGHLTTVYRTATVTEASLYPMNYIIDEVWWVGVTGTVAPNRVPQRMPASVPQRNQLALSALQWFYGYMAKGQNDTITDGILSGFWNSVTANGFHPDANPTDYTTYANRIDIDGGATGGERLRVILGADDTQIYYIECWRYYDAEESGTAQQVPCLVVQSSSGVSYTGAMGTPTIYSATTLTASGQNNLAVCFPAEFHMTANYMITF